MPYYHVYIERNNLGSDIYEKDRTDLSELKNDIVLPYLKGNQFRIDGYFLDKTKIERILIKESDISYKEYTERKRRSRFPAMLRDIRVNDEYFRNITEEVFKECESLLQETTSKSEAPISNKPKAPMDKSKVFIVHGHDDAAKSEAARFVEKIGLEAIILHEQASLGDTIIEKIEKNSNVGFAIVLYTPCDEGAPKGEKNHLKPRARQNVVFEHGYLMAKIGRKNVCPLVKGDLETPTDISGIVYTPMDEGGAWKYKVAKEMRDCGYDVDLNKI